MKLQWIKLSRWQILSSNGTEIGSIMRILKDFQDFKLKMNEITIKKDEKIIIAPYLLFIGTFCLVLIEGLLLLIHFFQCSISGIIHNHSHCIIPRRVRWDLLHQEKQKRILLTTMRNTWLVNTFFSQTRIKLCHFTRWSLTPFIVTQVWAPCYWASNSVNSVCLLQSCSPGPGWSKAG